MHASISMPEFIRAHLGRHFEGVLEAMTDGVWICDATPRLLWINTACEQLNDICREDVCGRTVQELLEMGNFDDDVTHRVLQERRPVAINQKVRSGRTLLVNGVPVFDDSGEVLFVVGNERDLTELIALRDEVEYKHQLNNRISSELLALKLRNAKLKDIVAESEPMERVLDTALRVSAFDATVLVTGPSGAGKSLIANVIHEGSPRREAPLLSLNCGAIPTALIEAELFGYIGGAFTGADPGGKPGLLEAANNGTLFLDEIDSFPLSSQVKLLTFLDTQRFMRVGDTKPRQVDVRLIAATNKDLGQFVRQGKFREDLWFRLNVVPVNLPPLAGRREDIPALVRGVLEALRERYGIQRTLTPAALELLCRYSFPGNVRELQNVLERSFVLCRGDEISADDLPVELREEGLADQDIVELGTLRAAIDQVEREWLSRACKRYNRQVDIAVALGISQPTVARMLKKHNLALAEHSFRIE